MALYDLIFLGGLLFFLFDLIILEGRLTSSIILSAWTSIKWVYQALPGPDTLPAPPIMTTIFGILARSDSIEPPEDRSDIIEQWHKIQRLEGESDRGDRLFTVLMLYSLEFLSWGFLYLIFGSELRAAYAASQGAAAAAARTTMVGVSSMMGIILAGIAFVVFVGGLIIYILVGDKRSLEEDLESLEEENQAQHERINDLKKGVRNAQERVSERRSQLHTAQKHVQDLRVTLAAMRDGTTKECQNCGNPIVPYRTEDVQDPPRIRCEPSEAEGWLHVTTPTKDEDGYKLEPDVVGEECIIIPEDNPTAKLPE